MLNKDTNPQNASIVLKNYPKNSQNQQWILKGSTPESKDAAFYQADSARQKGSQIHTELKPLSVTVISLSKSASE